MFKPLVDELLHQDIWSKMSILKVSRMGKFSSDRANQEYYQDIWKVQAVQVAATK